MSNLKYWKGIFRERYENYAGIRLSDKDCKEIYDLLKGGKE